METGESVQKQVLLFGFDDLRGILTVKTALEPFGVEAVPVGRSDYGKTLAALAGLEEDAGGVSVSGGVLPGRMALLCGLTDAELESLLPALRDAGAGAGCLKAVLTSHNRSWNVWRLYEELSQEEASIRGGSGRALRQQ